MKTGINNKPAPQSEIEKSPRNPLTIKQMEELITTIMSGKWESDDDDNPFKGNNLFKKASRVLRTYLELCKAYSFTTSECGRFNRLDDGLLEILNKEGKHIGLFKPNFFFHDSERDKIVDCVYIYIYNRSFFSKGDYIFSQRFKGENKSLREIGGFSPEDFLCYTSYFMIKNSQMFAIIQDGLMNWSVEPFCNFRTDNEFYSFCSYKLIRMFMDDDLKQNLDDTVNFYCREHLGPKFDIREHNFNINILLFMLYNFNKINVTVHRSISYPKFQ